MVCSITSRSKAICWSILCILTQFAVHCCSLIWQGTPNDASWWIVYEQFGCVHVPHWMWTLEQEFGDVPHLNICAIIQMRTPNWYWLTHPSFSRCPLYSFVVASAVCSNTRKFVCMCKQESFFMNMLIWECSYNVLHMRITIWISHQDRHMRIS